MQLMDEAVSDNANEVGSRPSGRGGSKISSRSSEHSIAKLMETLQATAGGSAVPPTPSPSLQSLKNQTTSVTSVDEQPQVSVSMAQSMPASMLTNQLQVRDRNKKALYTLLLVPQWILKTHLSLEKIRQIATPEGINIVI